MTTTAGDDAPIPRAVADAVARVEAELAFQGDGLRELGDALATQQMDILTLREQVRLLSAQLKALRSELAQSSGAAPAGDETPPHY